MDQTTFPEVQAAADALKQRITLTESEIAPLKAIVDAKENLIRQWRSQVAILLPEETSQDPAFYPFGIFDPRYIARNGK